MSASADYLQGQTCHSLVQQSQELGVHVHDPKPIPMTVSAPALAMHAFLVTRWEGEPVNAAPEEQT